MFINISHYICKVHGIALASLFEGLLGLFESTEAVRRMLEVSSRKDDFDKNSYDATFVGYHYMFSQ